jgi:Ca2+/Na+ antiporter
LCPFFFDFEVLMKPSRPTFLCVSLTAPGEDDDEEAEEVPEDLADLPVAQQRRRIVLRAIYYMGVGTLVVLIFSDAMVDVLGELAKRSGIPAFYVAFVLAPLASNASELIASVNYASKKTRKTVTISLSALLGAACMNNTFGLSIFLAVVFFRDIPWTFSAETLAILLVELAVFTFMYFCRTQKTIHASISAALYPLSLLLVWILENVAKLN